MPKRLFLALVLVVAAPLVLLGWLSAGAYRQREVAARKQIDDVFQGRLGDLRPNVVEVFDGYSRRLDQMSLGIRGRSQTEQASAIAGIANREPVVRSVVWLDRRGNLIFPPPPSMANSDEAVLYSALRTMVDARPSLGSGQRQDTDTRSGLSQRKLAPVESALAPAASNPEDATWQVWYMDEGTQLIRWRTDDGGKTMVGFLLERSRWISDLTASLPDSPLGGATEGSGFTALIDERDRVVYRWGDQSDRRDEPLATRPLPSPMTHWQWQIHGNDPIPRVSIAATSISLAGIGIVLMALGGYVLTGVRRQMTEARSRVSFASQVSHELRTPLTNIRLYAELAESDLQTVPACEARGRLEKRLGVIDTESRRLGRLVSGVLEVIRDGGKSQPLRLTAVPVDQVIEQALTQFMPVFESMGMTVDRTCDPGSAGADTWLDPDVIEMILVNLLSNVEKYAASGGRVSVDSRVENGRCTIRVSDQGPGISASDRKRVFKAFERIDDSISAPSGTGIGLTIARRLAVRHGGTLQLVDSERGCTFELQFPVTRESGDGAEENSR